MIHSTSRFEVTSRALSLAVRTMQRTLHSREDGVRIGVLLLPMPFEGLQDSVFRPRRIPID